MSDPTTDPRDHQTQNGLTRQQRKRRADHPARSFQDPDEGDRGGACFGGLAEGEDQEHRRAGRDLSGEQGERGADGRIIGERGERGEGRGVDDEESPDPTDPHASVFEDRPSPLLRAPHHERIPRVEHPVGVVQPGREQHSPKRQGCDHAGRHRVG